MNELISDNDVSSFDITRSLPKQLLEDSKWQYLGQRYAMTARETQVARLICCGLGNDLIAAPRAPCVGSRADIGDPHSERNTYRLSGFVSL